jgi:hypothetical protein
MWLIAGAIFFGCKWMTWAGALRAQGKAFPANPFNRFNLINRPGQFWLWPGMDADAFFVSRRPKPQPSRRWLSATTKTCIGAAVLCFAARAALTRQPLWVGWLGMLGIILLLHFGLFDLLALAWRSAGIDVKPLMRSPLRATSLGDFWGRRWNTAFNDLAHEYVFTPVRRALGGESGRGLHALQDAPAQSESARVSARSWSACSPLPLFALGKRGLLRSQRSGYARPEDGTRRLAVPLATLATFALSGLIHELVISVPARGGYGLPTAYFLLQGFAVLAERSRIGRRIGLGHGFRGWLSTLICTAGPAFWLFHPPFVRNVILPMLQAFGGS